MKYTTRDLVTLAVFGTLWGLSEVTLGTVLKSFNVPISGVVLAAIGLIVALVGRVFVPKRGSTLFVGVIAMLLKLFSLGGVIIGPMIGIMSEAVVAELALSLSGKPRRGTMMLTGSLGVLWVLVQPFVTNPLLFGRAVVDVWLDLLRRGGHLLGLWEGVVMWILGGMVLLHLVIGVVVGLISWTLGQQLQGRLGRSGESEAA